MKRVLVLCVFAPLVISCGKPQEPHPRPNETRDFGALYAENCAGCHGPEGRQGAAQPLNDAVYQALVDSESLRRVISNGVPGTAMPAFSKASGGMLTDAEISILVDHMKKTWSNTAAITDVPLPPYVADRQGDSSRGRAAYQTFCSQCHGPDGSGGPRAHSIVDESYLALVSDRSLRTSIIVGRQDQGMPGWRDDVPNQPMSPQQISDIVTWLASHRVKGEINLP